MKAIVFVTAFCFCSVFCIAQNELLNPGLEYYITCPGFGQFSSAYINNWSKPTYGSTDYYHYNCPGIIPTQQVPHSGDAYAGIICYNYGTEYREYMTGTLASPLIPGATYYCEFYVSLNDGYIQAIKEIGAYFSTTPPGPYPNALHVPVTPQVENTIILLDDTASWMRISGYFLAAGGEQYITIGNFNNDTNTTIVQVGNTGSYGAYYFVDDAWVSLSEGTGVVEIENGEFNLYPNPVGNKLAVSSGQYAIDAVSIFNSLGKKMLTVRSIHETDFNGYELDLGMLSPGMYVVEVRCGEKVFRKKIIRQ